MLTIAIQAGGESRRMGQDKALLPFLGKPLITRVIERMSFLGDEILVTTNNLTAYVFLNLPLFPDIFPGRGALGGLYTAVASANQPFVAVVACDMPFANPELLAALRDRLLAENTDLAVPSSPEGVEPFHAVYRRETCLPAIRAALDTGQQRIISWFSAVKVSPFSLEEVARYDPEHLAFTNVNTAEEFQLAEQKALELESG